MSSIFQTLEQRVWGFIKSKLKLGSLTVENIRDVCKLHQTYLTSIHDTLKVFSDGELSTLREKYLSIDRRGVDKYNAYPIILDLKQNLHGKAGLFERAKCFGAAEKVAKKLIEISEEISKNVPAIARREDDDTDASKKPGYTISIKGAKITDVLMLGILREIDLFINYTSYLWEYFRKVIDHDGPQMPYRCQYLVDNEDAYMAILENVADKANNYSFMKEIDVIKRKNADLTLYANQSSFLPFLNRRNYSADDELHLTHGILGLNIFAWVVSKWENWKYAQYKKAQKHREWLKQEEFRFKQLLNEQDPNSPQAKQTQKYIDAYSAEISKLDKEISEYEGVEVNE